MQPKTSILEPLLEKVEQYSITGLEILKLKTVAKTADVSAALSYRMLLLGVLTIFILFANIAIALWLGDVLGRSYFGFLVVSSCYALIAVIIYLAHPAIKLRFNNFFITHLLN